MHLYSYVVRTYVHVYWYNLYKHYWSNSLVMSITKRNSLYINLSMAKDIRTCIHTYVCSNILVILNVITTAYSYVCTHIIVRTCTYLRTYA